MYVNIYILTKNDISKNVVECNLGFSIDWYWFLQYVLLHFVVKYAKYAV